MARLSLPSPRLSRRPSQPKTGTDSRRDLRSLLSTIRTLTRNRWQVVVSVGCVIAAGLYWFGVRPANETLDTARFDAVAAERRASNLRQEYADLQSPEGASAAQQRVYRAEEYDALLPTSLSPVEMLAVVSSAAEVSGVSVDETAPTTRPTPGPTDRTEAYAFAITVSGDREGIASFLQELTSSNPLVTVDTATLTYTPETDESRVVRVSATLDVKFWTSLAPSLGDIRAELALESAGDNPTDSTPPPSPAPPSDSPATPAPLDDNPVTPAPLPTPAPLVADDPPEQPVDSTDPEENIPTDIEDDFTNTPTLDDSAPTPPEDLVPAPTDSPTTGDEPPAVGPSTVNSDDE